MSDFGSLSVTDFDSAAGVSVSDGDAAANGVSAGTLLRHAREAAGMHIATLAVSLKVPVKKLEALEQDRFDLLPDSVFVRALASSVCRTLKLDAAQVLERLPQTRAPKLIYTDAGINTPFRSPGDGPGPSLWAQIASRPAVLAGLMLVLGAVVLIFLPALKLDSMSGKPGKDSPVAGGEPAKSSPVVSFDEPKAGLAMVSLQAVEPVVTTPTATAPPASPPPMTLALVTAPESPGAAGLNPPGTLSAIPAPNVASVPARPASQAASSGILTFRAKGESWIEVTDAKGTVVLRRTLAAGEVVGASGALPLATVIGKADATQVLVRGQAFDLMSVSKDNVARFEVK